MKKKETNSGKRVNNVLHDIQILEPMARSASYDFTRADVDAMFNAMQETLDEAREEFNKKFEEKARAEKKVFSFSATTPLEDDTVSIEETPAGEEDAIVSTSSYETVTSTDTPNF